MDSIVSISSQKKKPAAPPQGNLSYYSYDNGDDNDGDEDGDDDTRIRCILCTTAAGWFFFLIFDTHARTIIYRAVCISYEPDPNSFGCIREKMCLCVLWHFTTDFCLEIEPTSNSIGLYDKSVASVEIFADEKLYSLMILILVKFLITIVCKSFFYFPFITL